MWSGQKYRIIISGPSSERLTAWRDFCLNLKPDSLRAIVPRMQHTIAQRSGEIAVKPSPRAPLPIYERAQVPPPIQLTSRDKAFLTTIYRFEGILADYQIKRLFFDSTPRMMARMSLLYHNGYVARPTKQQRAQLSYNVYWLDSKGIEYIASEEGVEPRELLWRKPGERWSLVPHDIELNDVRIAVTEALKSLPGTELTDWISSLSFWRDYDTVIFADRNGKTHRRYIRPDAAFHITSPSNEKTRHSQLLLELDRSTEHNPRFVREKVIPGIAYIHNQEYRERFGVNAGRWLVVTKSERRLANMLRQTATIPEAHKYFYFTTLQAALTPGAFFTQPIWRRPATETQVALLRNAQ